MYLKYGAFWGEEERRGEERGGEGRKGRRGERGEERGEPDCSVEEARQVLKPVLAGLVECPDLGPLPINGGL